MAPNIEEAEQGLLNKIRELAVAKLKLSQVRSQPRPDQNEIWSAAQAFRATESGVQSATEALVGMHERMMLQLAKEATEEETKKS